MSFCVLTNDVFPDKSFSVLVYDVFPDTSFCVIAYDVFPDTSFCVLSNDVYICTCNSVVLRYVSRHEFICVFINVYHCTCPIVLSVDALGQQWMLTSYK